MTIPRVKYKETDVQLGALLGNFGLPTSKTGKKSLKAADSTRKERFDDFLARAEEEGFINTDDADNLRTDYLNGDIADDDLPLLLEDAIDDDLDQDDVAESRNRLGLVALLGTLTARALLRDRLQSEFEGTVRDLATNDNIPDWQSTFSTAVSNNIIDQALLGRGEAVAEGDVDDETLQALSDVIQEQQGYLSRFADDRAVSDLLGDPMTEEEVAARSELYSGAGRTEFFAGAEDEEAEDGYVIDYVAVGDNSTCEPCLQAEQDGPYLPGDEDSPYPGTVCDGHGRCRCERIMRYAPDEWAALMGKSRRTVKAEFSEEQHPRDEHGRFAGGSGGTTSSESISQAAEADTEKDIQRAAEVLEREAKAEAEQAGVKDEYLVLSGNVSASERDALEAGAEGRSTEITYKPQDITAEQAEQFRQLGSKVAQTESGQWQVHLAHREEQPVASWVPEGMDGHALLQSLNIRSYFAEPPNREARDNFAKALRGEYGNKFQKAAEIMQRQAQSVFRARYGEEAEFHRTGAAHGVFSVSESRGAAQHASSIVSGQAHETQTVRVRADDVIISHRTIQTTYPEREWIVKQGGHKSLGNDLSAILTAEELEAIKESKRME